MQAGLAFLPMTVVNFAVTVPVRRLIAPFGSSAVLAVGVAVTFAAMAWLSRVQVDSGYFTAVAPAMMLIGAGRGLAFAPLTSAGLIGVRAGQPEAASGVFNTFHQLGMALGLSVLVAASAGAGDGAPTTTAALIAEIDVTLTVAAGMLALCLICVPTLIAPPVRATPVDEVGATITEPALA